MGDIYISRPPPTRRSIKSRQLRAIDSTIFRDEVVSCLTMLSDNTPDDVNVMGNSFNDTLSTLLDKHAPIKTRKISLRPKAPWYTDSVRASKERKEKTWAQVAKI